MAALTLMSLTTGIPTPAVSGGTGWCTDYEGNNFPCYDDTSTDTGYGGCGCAAYDTTYYDDSYNTTPTYVGEYHPEHPNVVWNGDNWVPESGFEWTSDDPDDYTVQRLYGSKHPDFANVEWRGDGWYPMEGYTWASDDTDNFSVVLSGPDANREMLAAYMGELTGQLNNFDEELISAAGTKVVSLASFFIDYTYQAAR